MTREKEHRGFASMDIAKRRELASKGGRAAHVNGTAYQWTTESAREAGRQGGINRARRAREAAESAAAQQAAPALVTSDE